MNKTNVKTGIQAHSKDKSGKNVKNWEKKKLIRIVCTNGNAIKSVKKKLQPNTSQMKKVMFTISAKYPQSLL